jgi:hypothetical protein
VSGDLISVFDFRTPNAGRRPHLTAHFAGHVENGEDSISDPLIGGV